MPVFAVFGDIHGHLRLLFELCRRWQEAEGRRIDAILQCGDMGWFPDATRIDRATRKYAKEDPEELGVSMFFAPGAPERDERLEETLLGDPASLSTVTAEVYWCHGNHEDFQALRQAVGTGNAVAVDRYRRLRWCRPGTVVEVAGVRVGVLGGGPELGADKRDDPWKHIQQEDADALAEQRFDVLLTHPAPQGIGGESDDWGSARAREVVELAEPGWHFFAHHRRAIVPATIGPTRCRWLDDTGFGRDGRLRVGCMGIFDGASFTGVDGAWARAMTWWSWRG